MLLFATSRQREHHGLKPTSSFGNIGYLLIYFLSYQLPLQGIEDVSVDDRQTWFLGFGVNLFPLLRFLIL